MAEQSIENMEDVFKHIGGLGRFQIIMLSLMLFLEIPTAFLAFSPIVIAIPPNEWLCDNVTILHADACSCEGELLALNPEHSILTEWNLICDLSWVSDTILSIQLVGTLFGTMFVSMLADWYGRRYSYFAASFLMLIGTVLTAVATGPYTYLLARIVSGLSLAGFMSLSVVYMMEFLTPEYRILPSSVGMMGEGVMLLALLAHYIRPWRTLLWITVAPYLMCFVVYMFVPESPRWLLRQQRVTESHKVLARIAKINGKPNVEIKHLEAIMDKELSSSTQKPTSDSDIQDPEAARKVQRFSYWDFYRQASLRRTTIILQIMWFSWGVVYFGITFNVKNLGLNLYVSLGLMGLADALGYPVALLIPKRHGRLKIMVTCLSVSAAFLAGIAVLRLFTDLKGYEFVIGALSFFGKFGLSAARSPFRTLTGESYPTAVRSMGLGFARVFASIGAALGPQLVFFGMQWPALPYFVFAGIGAMNCAFSFKLTETGDKAMTEEVKVNEKTKVKVQEK